MTPTEGWTPVPIDGYPHAEARVDLVGGTMSLACDSQPDIYSTRCLRWQWRGGKWIEQTRTRHGMDGPVPRTLPPPHVAATLMLLYPEVFT